ncbi:MAG TPA: hypothetical protein VNM87_12920, partial [Candidatus Udaeobacter sp.]|nr:hypothetical protein [Candidatus Udaeobacter sp.]
MNAPGICEKLRSRSPALPLLLVALAIASSPVLATGEVPPVHLVLFTHIEDNTPAGALGSPQSQQNYLLYRGRLIEMGNLALTWGVPWSLQPDWKILQAALLYETPALMQTTNNKNFLRYLKEDLGAVIDPHSHESGGYNYTDVAHLLDSLGVGGSTVIGGHVWDPSLPQFQEWDRYRVPVAGEHYPGAEWRGDILMGSGTPNHVNDPIVSGVWRPRDRFHYFEHDSTANIAAIGAFRSTIEGVQELAGLYQSGVVPAHYLLTASYPIKPSTLIRPDGIQSIADSVMAPVVTMRDAGLALPTDFTSLIAIWETVFDGRGFVYDAKAQTGMAAVDAPPAESVVIAGIA